MAKLKHSGELPDDIIKDFEHLRTQLPHILEEMTYEGAKVVYKNILRNMKHSFSHTENLEPHLQITRAYRTYSGKYVNTKVAFYGYYRKNNRDYTLNKKAKEGHEYLHGRGQRKRMSSGRKAASYTYEGVPVPLITAAREYGTSNGERKVPFMKQSFNDKAGIQAAMKRVHDKYIKG